VHDTLIEHGVERHLPYAVCVENEGCSAGYSHSAWRGATCHMLCVWKMEECSL